MRTLHTQLLTSSVAVTIACLAIFVDKLCFAGAVTKPPEVRSSSPHLELLYQRFPEDGQQWELCLLDFPSNKTTLLLSSKETKELGRHTGSEVSFSPDGDMILFEATRRGSAADSRELHQLSEELLDVWALDRKTKQVKRLTHDGQGYFYVEWSPAGRYACAVGKDHWLTDYDLPPISEPGYRTDSYVLDSVTGRRWFVQEDTWTPRWTQDGKALLIKTDDYRLFLWDTRTHKKRLIARNLQSAVSAPDGSQVVYCQTGGTWASYDILTKKTRRLAKGGLTGYFLSFPPRGKLIAYMAESTDTLMLFDVLTGQSRALVKGYGTFYVWSPDGRTLAITNPTRHYGDDPHTTRLMIADAATGVIRDLHTFQDDASVLAWTGDGKSLIVLNRPMKRSRSNDEDHVERLPEELHLVSVSGGVTKRLITLPVTSDYPDVFRHLRLAGKS